MAAVRVRGYLCGQPHDVVGEEFLTSERLYAGMCFIVYSRDEFGHHFYAIVLLELAGIDHTAEAV